MIIEIQGGDEGGKKLRGETSLGYVRGRGNY